MCYFFFFFQAEDGIRDLTVTGVQTCALPILREIAAMATSAAADVARTATTATGMTMRWWRRRRPVRSEEHTSELQSQSNLVCRLLLEKKKKTIDSFIALSA